MYLKSDVIGPYSRKHYGSKGDKVEVIMESDKMVVVKGSFENFPTTCDNLSEVPVPKEILNINSNGNQNPKSKAGKKRNS